MLNIEYNKLINYIDIKLNIINDKLRHLQYNALCTRIYKINVEDIFNKRKMYDNLEGPESGEQEGEGLKLLTPNKILSRLPISLTHLKAGYNSEKF